MCEVYKLFSKDWEGVLNYDEESLVELFVHESHGGTQPRDDNGYYVGKRWLNVFVAMWKEDIEQGYLYKFELYESGHWPEWWLESILENIHQGSFLIKDMIGGRDVSS